MSKDNLELRYEFAGFLKRVASGCVRPLEWNRFMVQHYPDKLLESIRVKTAKLFIDRAGGKEWSNSELAMLQHWSRQLRKTDADER